MLLKVQAALSKLLAPGQPLLVGVSGGADSVALLDLLVCGGWRPHVCHLNHQLRGAESEADAEFVRQFATRYGLECMIGVAEGLVGAPLRAGRPGEPNRGGDAAPTWKGLEDACRQARFEFFASVAKPTGIYTLALAHTADDQVETFLLRLFRGAGMAGLGAMRAERQIGTLRVIRPLLSVSRAEVLKHLSAEGLKYREDSSNVDRRFTRNRIRHELLPLLEREYNPAIRDVLARTADVLREEDRCLDDLARAHVTEALHVPTLTKLAVALQRRVIRQWLGGEFEQIEAVRTLTGELHLPGGVVVHREYDWLRKADSVQCSVFSQQWPVAVPGETVVSELGVRLFLECADLSALSGREKRQSSDKSEHSTTERFDADALGAGLFIRTWREGDRFQPLGMSGEKKLQDFFVDEKVPRRQRGRVPLLCAVDGRIAWVVGYRIAEPFKVTEKTQQVVRVRVEAVQR